VSKGLPPTSDPFWYFFRGLFRYRGLIAATFLFVLLSGMSLWAGLLGASPVLRAILGDKQELRTFAVQFNERLVKDASFLSFLQVPDHLIARLPTDPFESLVWIMGGLCVLAVFGSACTYFHAYLSLTVVNRHITAIRRGAFHAALRAPLLRISQQGPSDTISRIVNDTGQLANGLTVLLSKAVLQVFKGIAALAVSMTIEWRVTLAALAITPILYTIIRKLGKRIKRAANAALQSQSGLYSAASESLQGLRVVKVHTTELLEAGRFHRKNKQMLSELNRVRTARALASPLTEALSIFLLCGLVLIAAKAILTTGLSADRILLALGSLAVAGASLKPMTGIITEIQTTQPAAQRIKELLDTPPEPGHTPGLPKLPRHKDTIAFEDVRVRYPGANRDALGSITLSIKAGERIAFVGPNGCGKTTLLGLVPRLYEPSAGRICVDGHDIAKVSVRSLRAQIGVVTQETVLFQGTIAHNIGYGTGASREAVIAAAKSARAHEFIEQLASGYDTILAEGGSGLSGGQRQRLAIARAILRQPAILILDEATSMIDTESESKISESLAEFSTGRTTLIVAHRLNTILSCDRIVVMDQGNVVDQGTHTQLLARCALYQTLVRSQFGTS
jgi:subfamily B ATP-binding cassette protein MsbA